MKVKIYDRSTNELYTIVDIIGMSSETLSTVKIGFKKYLDKKLASGEPLDSDIDELFEYIELLGYEIEHIGIEGEIDL